jgi:hypothetical protein
MMKVFARCCWLSLLGLVLGVHLAGCADPNESEFKSEGPSGTGVADPKYAAGTPDQYRQFKEDAKKNVAPAKAKMVPAKGKAAVLEQKP